MNRVFRLSLYGLILSAVCAASAHAMGRIPKKVHEQKVKELQDKNNKCAAKLADETTQAKAKIGELEAANNQLLKDMESSKSDLQKRLAEIAREKQEVEKE